MIIKGIILIIVLLIIILIILSKITVSKNNFFEPSYFLNNRDFNILSKEPLIFTIDNFLSDEECEFVMEISKKRNFTRAYVLDDNKGTIIDESRTNYCNTISNNDDIFIQYIVDKVSSTIKFPSKNAESIELLRYNKKQEFKHHYDGFKQSYNSKNQRILTALVYLNDVEQGGETDFKNLNLSIKPEKGKLLVFQNCLKDNQTIHPNSFHAGLPVLKGEKFAFNLWYHNESTYLFSIRFIIYNHFQFFNITIIR